MYAEYSKYPLITKQRMFYETMEELLPSMKVYIVDESGTQKMLPLDSFTSSMQADASARANGAGANSGTAGQAASGAGQRTASQGGASAQSGGTAQNGASQAGETQNSSDVNIEEVAQ